MKFFIKAFFSNCDQIRSFLLICSYLLKKSLLENFIFCAVSHSRIIYRNKVLYNSEFFEENMSMLDFGFVEMNFCNWLVLF